MIYWFEAAGFEQPVMHLCADDEDALRTALETCVEVSRAAKELVCIIVRDDEGREVGRVPSVPASEQLAPNWIGSGRPRSEWLYAALRRVRDQEERVAWLNLRGHDTRMAEELLDVFRQSLALHERTRHLLP
jgi:hypothetical protein